jgi:hypothetical protein
MKLFEGKKIVLFSNDESTDVSIQELIILSLF